MARAVANVDDVVLMVQLSAGTDWIYVVSVLGNLPRNLGSENTNKVGL